MNFVTRKSFLMKLIISIFIIIFLFNTISVNYSYGVTIGGILFKPIAALCGIILIAVNGVVGIFLGGGEDIYDKLVNQSGNWLDLLASPEHIFAGSYPILDANIFKAQVSNTIGGTIAAEFRDGAGASLIIAIKKAVSGVYYVLRNTAAVALLCLLIYAGIRIVLAANSPNEKSKWKEYLMDWLKGLALVIFVHCLMIAIFYFTDIIKEAFGETLSGSKTIAALCAEKLTWGSWNLDEQIVALVMFGYVTYMTIIFIIAYYKRLVWTVMLIVIAPVVAVVYPLNSKGYDGKGVFGRWIKEFVMNAILPVYHMVIYYVLTILPMNIAESGQTGVGIPGIQTGNVFALLYALFSISMIRPAEKFFRWLFGIEGKVANQGSFDSGKKTFDAIADVVKKIALLATAAATGGATLAAGGAVAGGATAGATAEGVAEGVALGGAEGGAVDGILGAPGGDEGLTDGIMGEDITGGDITDGDITDGDMNINTETDMGSETNSDENTEINANAALGPEQGADNDRNQIIQELQEIKSLLASGAIDLGENNNTGGTGAHGGSGSDPEVMDVDEGGINTAALDGIDTGKEKEGILKKGFNRINRTKIGGRLIAEGSNLLTSEKGREALLGLKDSLHGLTDTMYVDGAAPGDWKNDPINNSIAEKVKERGEAERRAFVNKSNTQKMLDAHPELLKKHLERNTNSKGVVNAAKARADAEAEAKTLLERNSKFISYGIRDFDLLDKLGKYQEDTGLSVEDTVRNFTHTTKATQKYMIKHGEKVEVELNGEITDVDIKDSEKINALDPMVANKIKQAITDRTMNAMEYQIEVGGDDTKKSVRLSGLESRLNKTEIKVAGDKKDFVIKVDDTIDRDINNNNAKKVSVPGSEDDINLKNLENFINIEVKDNIKEYERNKAAQALW